jgi:hypothetical protein
LTVNDNPNCIHRGRHCRRPDDNQLTSRSARSVNPAFRAGRSRSRDLSPAFFARHQCHTSHPAPVAEPLTIQHKTAQHILVLRNLLRQPNAGYVNMARTNCQTSP